MVSFGAMVRVSKLLWSIYNPNPNPNLNLTITEQNRTEQNRTEQNRTEQNRTEQNRTEQNRTEQNRTEHNSLFRPSSDCTNTQVDTRTKYICIFI